MVETYGRKNPIGFQRNHPLQAPALPEISKKLKFQKLWKPNQTVPRLNFKIKRTLEPLLEKKYMDFLPFAPLTYFTLFFNYDLF